MARTKITSLWLVLICFPLFGMASDFVGYYSGDTVTLDVYPVRLGVHRGEITYGEARFQTLAVQNEGGLYGVFKNETGQFSFSLTRTPQGFVFATGNTAKLLKRSEDKSTWEEVGKDIPIEDTNSTIGVTSVKDGFVEGEIKVFGHPVGVRGTFKKHVLDGVLTDPSGKAFPFVASLGGGVVRLRSDFDWNSLLPEPVRRLRSATKDNPFVNSLGMEFIPVPGLPGIYMCRTETRVKDFSAFVEATGYDATEGGTTLETGGWKQIGGHWKNPKFPKSCPQTDHHPVSCMSWRDAQFFCDWLSHQDEGLMYRLPKDSEWSACVGNTRYSWGNQFPPPRGSGNIAGKEARIGAFGANRHFIVEGYDDGFPRTAPVGSFGANRFGFFDLGGNLAEWCYDFYRANLNDEETLRDSPHLENVVMEDNSFARVLRGSAWISGRDIELQSSRRIRDSVRTRRGNFGFRCAVTEKSPIARHAVSDSDPSIEKVYVGFVTCLSGRNDKRAFSGSLRAHLEGFRSVTIEAGNGFGIQKVTLRMQPAAEVSRDDLVTCLGGKVTQFSVLEWAEARSD